MKRTTIFVYAVILCFCLLAGMERVALAYVVIEKHPIDIEMERMLEENPSTAGLWPAYEYAMKEWDKLLNENYNALMKKLTKVEQEKLRASQREWIKYRDLEFAFNETYWSGFKGTMYVGNSTAYQWMFVRERALRLGYYLEDLNER